MNSECVILAGGLSYRCKTNKMLLQINNKTVIESCISAFYQVCSKIIVVTGYYHKDIYNILQNYKKIQVVYNKNYKKGMFSSVKVGISACNSNRFFLTPGDYPLLKNSTIKQLLHVNADFVYPTYNGISGHPILIKKFLIPRILYGNYTNLEHCLKGVHGISKEVEDIGVIKDIDTMQDYYKVL